MAFPDFNKDGYSDILIERNENTPSVFDLLLYDPNFGTFKEVKDFDLFPDPTPIPGTKLYYSYHRNGCADMDWVSDLFYLDHFRAVLIGKIHGSGCEVDLKRSIHIYKVTASRPVLLKTLPISTIGEYRDNKWGFIKQYWGKRYQQFL